MYAKGKPRVNLRNEEELMKKYQRVAWRRMKVQVSLVGELLLLQQFLDTSSENCQISKMKLFCENN